MTLVNAESIDVRTQFGNGFPEYGKPENLMRGQNETSAPTFT